MHAAAVRFGCLQGGALSWSRMGELTTGAPVADPAGITGTRHKATMKTAPSEPHHHGCDIVCAA